MSGSSTRWAKAIALPLAALVAAEIWFRGPGADSESLAPPTLVAKAWLEALADGTLALATLQTLIGAVGGLVLGAFTGLVLGFLIGLSRTAIALTTPSVELFRPIPSVALIPLALLVFGFGYRIEMAIVGFATFWPCLILAQAAASQIEPRLLEVSKVIGLTPAQRLWKIVLPAAMPRIFVALRLAAGFALVVAVTVEIAANPQGLGYMLMIAQQTLRPELMLASLFWIGFIGWAVNAGLNVLQGRLFRHQRIAAEART
ncbi:MAG: ABC transporter permease [Rhizobiales bacterium]|nr:ABC transporter permease [Hyphomicrobiales bacterium]